jgi:hypothetical protein
MKTLVVAGCFALGLASACTPREHIRDDYGQLNRKFFSMQRIYAKAAEGAPRGLDSEEAALIGASYRNQIGGESKEKPDAASRVLLVDDGGGKNARQK